MSDRRFTIDDLRQAFREGYQGGLTDGAAQAKSLTELVMGEAWCWRMSQVAKEADHAE